MIRIRSILLSLNLVGFCARAAAGWLGGTVYRGLVNCLPAVFRLARGRRPRRIFARFSGSLRELDEISLKWNRLAR